jgi:hypothetical protein
MQTAQETLGLDIAERTAADGTVLTAEDIFHKAAEKYANQHAGELIQGLDDTTKDYVSTALKDAISQGMTPQQISDVLNSNFAFSDSRAMTISRTETGKAWNMGSIGIGREAGHNAVDVSDGDSDPECQDADGQVWSLDYAESHPLEHPNCVRSFSSRYAEPDEIDRGDDDE